MTTYINELYEVHGILDRYIIIHDTIFKFSWRQTIPIPGFFKPIHYGQHVDALNTLISSLDNLSTSVSKNDDAPDVFNQYILSLLETMKFLRNMCSRLYDKSQGDLQSYPMDQYRADVATYERLVEKYHTLGATLNQYIS